MTGTSAHLPASKDGGESSGSQTFCNRGQMYPLDLLVTPRISTQCWNTFRQLYDHKFYIKLFGFYWSVDLWKNVGVIFACPIILGKCEVNAHRTELNAHELPKTKLTKAGILHYMSRKVFSHTRLTIMSGLMDHWSILYSETIDMTSFNAVNMHQILYPIASKVWCFLKIFIFLPQIMLLPHVVDQLQ